MVTELWMLVGSSEARGADLKRKAKEKLLISIWPCHDQHAHRVT